MGNINLLDTGTPILQGYKISCDTGRGVVRTRHEPCNLHSSGTESVSDTPCEAAAYLG